ncbi:MAG: MopE-related protein [archaeon]
MSRVPVIVLTIIVAVLITSVVVVAFRFDGYCGSVDASALDCESLKTEGSQRVFKGGCGVFNTGEYCNNPDPTKYGCAWNDEIGTNGAYICDRCSQGTDSCAVLEEAYVHGGGGGSDDTSDWYRVACSDWSSSWTCMYGVCTLPVPYGVGCENDCNCVGGCCDTNTYADGLDALDHIAPKICKGKKDHPCETADECCSTYPKCTYTGQFSKTCQTFETCNDATNPDQFCNLQPPAGSTPFCEWYAGSWQCVECNLDSDCPSAGTVYRCQPAQRIQSAPQIGDCTLSKTCALQTGTWSNTGTTCAGTENSFCLDGHSNCQNLCSDGKDNDGDGFTDTHDTDCGGCELCNGGSCCTTTGCYIPAGTTCWASAGVCDVAEVCSGTSGACPADAKLSGEQSCPDCTQCNGVANACVNIAVNTDPYNQCDPGTIFCSGRCRNGTTLANCDGAGACAEVITNTPANKVCGGAGVVVDASTQVLACDGNTDYSCTAGSCSGYYRYSECNGAGVCNNLANNFYQQYNVNAAANKVLTATCTNQDATSSTLACDGNTNYFCTKGACTGYYRYSECNGASVCDNAAATYYQETLVGPNNGFNLTTSCTWVAIPPGSLEFNCKDGIDNNCDGQIDECKENTYGKCINVTDDDSDGAADFPAEIDCRGRLNGTIFEAENPSAIVEGATVKGIPAGLNSQFQSSSNVSDYQGRYNVSALVGTYTFVASKKDYIDEIKTVTIGSGQNTTMNFNLRKGKNCHTDCTDSNNICSPACQGFSQGGDTCVLLKACEYRQKDYIAIVSDGANTTTYTCCEETTNTYKTMTPKITGNVETLYDYVFPAKINGVTPVKVHILYWETK